jgi:hypothetical protein
MTKITRVLWMLCNPAHLYPALIWFNLAVMGINAWLGYWATASVGALCAACTLTLFIYVSYQRPVWEENADNARAQAELARKFFEAVQRGADVSVMIDEELGKRH